ncbi:MAG: hypothetical protein IJ802_06440 [Kiritimatiellae bacterium]|nr:hypothetical protein [Kiritimatiellia bacterium]
MDGSVHLAEERLRLEREALEMARARLDEARARLDREAGAAAYRALLPRWVKMACACVLATLALAGAFMAGMRTGEARGRDAAVRELADEFDRKVKDAFPARTDPAHTNITRIVVQ